MKNTQNDTGKTHSSEGPDIFTDPAQIRRQAEEKAKTRPLPSPESMTREQIRQTFYEMQVRQIETELKNQQLCKGLELYADHAELLTAITENILDLVALTDLEGNLGFVGKSHEIFGYERQSMTGQNVMDYVHPDDLPRVLEAFKELVASGDPPRTEYRFRCRDGAYLWIETRGTLLKDENGHPRKILFSSRDISQRKQAEEAIEKERSYLSAVIDSIGEAIVICDAEGRISRFNETARQLHGLPEQPVLPEQWAEHYDLKWVELFAFPIKQEGNDKITGIVEYVRDITARRQAEKEREKLQVQLYQAQKMQSIGRLAGGVAHDFNNKLSIINGYAEMALDMLEKSDPLYDNIREIHRAGLHSADIVKQLLAFARKQTISPMQMDLNDTIGSLLKMLQRLIGENIDLAWYPGSHLWPVKMDPSQVDQILANLAVNARDAISDVGKMTIETKNVVFDKACCQTHAESTPGNYVMLAVSDNGCGMDKEVLDKAFEPFP